MKTYGLIGFPLNHSYSQKYFSEKFKRERITDCEFRNFPIENPSEIKALIESNDTLCGLSVTIPHKKSVMKLLDGLDDVAENVGAVNCIKINRNIEKQVVKLMGYNTDIFGFEKSLLPLLKSHHTKALVLGTGGAAKAVEYVLKKNKIDCLLVSRNSNSKINDSAQIFYKDVNEVLLSEFFLIINATPIGTFPMINESPDIPYQLLTDQHLLYDLIYNPEETEFLKGGREMGAQTKNGLEMLELQAEEAWKIWNS